MKLHYRLIQDANGWLAECLDAEAAGEGKTREEAVASLRCAIEERMFRPDAIAPPSSPKRAEIDLVLAPDGASLPEREMSKGGPGDPPRPIASSTRS